MRHPGIILAGGQSRRLGGGDKGLLALGPGGEPMIAQVIARLGCAAAISANGDPQRFAAFGLPVLADPVPGYPGPLAGVLAGMLWAAEQGAEAVITAAADTPFFPPSLAADLAAHAAETGARVVLPRAETPDGRRLHPTFGWWSVALAPALRAAIDAGQARIAPWAETMGLAVLEVPGDDPFFNVNTPADLAIARLRAQAATSR